MKVCVIGDIHGTDKWHECYQKIRENDNDCQRIIVCGDWFDPYDNIPFETMMEHYNEFLNDLKNDNRIISLLGNHDLDGYIISGQTNRTCRVRSIHKKITDVLTSNLSNSYLVYRIGNWLFSHAGVSQDWIDDNIEWKDTILSNKKGWTVDELEELCAYSPYDWSGYGNNARQGCTWIRPQALVKSHIEGYNQVVGHTRVERMFNLKDEIENFDTNIWIVDNYGKPEYLTFEIEDCE